MTQDPLKLPPIKPVEAAENIINFIKSSFQNHNKHAAVIALSGGIDSSTVAVLTTQALGADRIHLLLLPSLQSSVRHTDDAHRLSDDLGLYQSQIHEINLSGIQAAYLQTLHLYLPQHTPMSDARSGNLAARIRMSLVYDYAQTVNGLVVGTENQSELLLGYYTRFGDEASDLEPLKHLYKTHVYELARFLKLPTYLLDKAPTADLWADQTDESELGFSYQSADPILYQHHTQGKSLEQLIDMGFEPQLVHQVLARIKSFAYKRLVPYHLVK